STSVAPRPLRSTTHQPPEAGNTWACTRLTASSRSSIRTAQRAPSRPIHAPAAGSASTAPRRVPERWTTRGADATCPPSPVQLARAARDGGAPGGAPHVRPGAAREGGLAGGRLDGHAAAPLDADLARGGQHPYLRRPELE